MRKTLKKYFIPHPENDHQPHFLRTKTVSWMLGALVIVEFLFISQFFVVLPSANFLASVLPDAVIALTNANRTLASEGGLAVSPVLEKAAQAKANDMAAKSYFAHTSPEGISPWYWFQRVGYRYTHAGENLAINFYDSKDVVEAWMRSEGHRKNILNANYTEIGIGVATGIYQGREAVFIVQLFGRPFTLSSPFASGIPVVEAKEKETPVPSVSVAPPSPVIRPLSSLPQELSIEIGHSAFPRSGETEIAAPSEPSISSVLSENALIVLARSLLSAPRTAMAYGYVLLVILFGTALFLKLSLHMHIRHPRLVANGFFMIFFVTVLGYFNRELAFFVGKVF